VWAIAPHSEAVVAVHAEDAITRRKATSFKPVIYIHLLQMLAMLVATAVDVVDCEKLNQRFSATSTVGDFFPAVVLENKQADLAGAFPFVWPVVGIATVPASGGQSERMLAVFLEVSDIERQVTFADRAHLEVGLADRTLDTAATSGARESGCCNEMNSPTFTVGFPSWVTTVGLAQSARLLADVKQDGEPAVLVASEVFETVVGWNRMGLNHDVNLPKGCVAARAAECFQHSAGSLNSSPLHNTTQLWKV